MYCFIKNVNPSPLPFLYSKYQLLDELAQLGIYGTPNNDKKKHLINGFAIWKKPSQGLVENLGFELTTNCSFRKQLNYNSLETSQITEWQISAVC